MALFFDQWLPGLLSYTAAAPITPPAPIIPPVPITPPPITFDAASTDVAGNVTALDWSHPGGAAPGAALVWISYYNLATTTISYGGQQMEPLFGQLALTTGVEAMQAFGLIDPPPGEAAIDVATESSSYLGAVCVTYDGVSGFGSPTTGTGVAWVDLAQNVTLEANQWAAQAFVVDGQPISDYNQTSRANLPYTPNVNIPLLAGDAPGPGDVQFTATANNGAWAGAAIPLLPQT
jgi:hypothetical protein